MDVSRKPSTSGSAVFQSIGTLCIPLWEILVITCVSRLKDFSELTLVLCHTDVRMSRQSQVSLATSNETMPEIATQDLEMDLPAS